MAIMNIITKEKVDILFNAMADKLVYLYSRWLDEKEYEPWADYMKAMRENFDKAKKEHKISNAEFVHSHKRPFGFTFDFEGWQIKMTTNSKQVKWDGAKLGFPGE